MPGTTRLPRRSCARGSPSAPRWPGSAASDPVPRVQDQATYLEQPEQRSFLVVLVVLTFAMNLIARGVPETFAVFLLPVQQGLGVSRADITLTYSVYMLAYAVSAPFAGRLIDRFGARVAYGFG